MSTNKRFYWLKLKEDFFEDDTIQWLEEQENGSQYALFYLKLCLKALKTEGTLIRFVGQQLIPYDKKALAKLTNTNPDTVAVAMDLFNKIGLIELMDSGEIYLTQINELVGSETDKAVLMRRKRARNKIGNNVTPPLPDVNQSKSIEKELDKESEKDREKDKESEVEEEEEKKESAAPAPNVYQFYQENIGVLNPITMQSIDYWIDDLSEELVIEALKRAALDQKGFRWAEGIMKSWEKNNIRTMQQVEAEDVAFANQSKKKSAYGNKSARKETLPDWAKGEQSQKKEEKPVSKETQENFMKRLEKIRSYKRE